MNKPLKRVLFWSIVAVYTLMLNEVIIVYNTIVTHFSRAVASKIPLLLICLAGAAYVIFLLIKKHITPIAWLIPCAMIVYLIFRFEPLANKRIHIPEYILMVWLLYATVSIDYSGKGRLLLIFVCACLLGVIDELLQGIHPARYYGWRDMCINVASCATGVLMVMGLTPPEQGNYKWMESLKTRKGTMLLIFMGASGACITCACLFYVKETGDFQKAYPLWLVAWNCLFVAASPVALYCGHHQFNQEPVPNNRLNPDHEADIITAEMWLFLPLVVLTVIHSIAIFIAASGAAFS